MSGEDAIEAMMTAPPPDAEYAAMAPEPRVVHLVLWRGYGADAANHAKGPDSQRHWADVTRELINKGCACSSLARAERVGHLCIFDAVPFHHHTQCTKHTRGPNSSFKHARPQGRRRGSRPPPPPTVAAAPMARVGASSSSVATRLCWPPRFFSIVGARRRVEGRRGIQTRGPRTPGERRK